MKKAIIMLTAIMSFSGLANSDTLKAKQDIPEIVVYGVDLQSDILERKEKLKNDMVLSRDEMQEIFSSNYKIETKRLEDYDFEIVQEKN